MKRLLAIALLAITGSAGAATIRVSAAASLSDVLQELARKYETATGDRIVANFGSSGSLARQIIEGAPADIFISADERQMDRVAARGLVLTPSRRSIVSNDLVLIVPADSAVSPRKIDDLEGHDVGRIAVGDPETVPAGAYAREYLRQGGVWTRITPKLIPLENVRAALAAVESGNVDCGIVFKSDALISRLVRIALTIGGSPEITYPAAVIADSRQRAAAQRFLDFLSSAGAQAVFARYGFLKPTRR